MKTGEIRHETVVGLTSRSPDQAPPEVLLGAARQHGTIENKGHWTRDVTWKEDQSRVRTGAAPHILASFRNVVLSWMNLKRQPRVARQIRAFGRQQDRAMAFVTDPV